VLDCLILINDRTDGIPRVRVALSNGGSFDYLGYLTDIPPASQPLTVVQQAQPHAEPSLQLLPPPAYNDTPIRSELASLKNRVAELERIIDGLHQVAIERMKSRV
jgi:hypothetical protein